MLTLIIDDEPYIILFGYHKSDWMYLYNPQPENSPICVLEMKTNKWRISKITTSTDYTGNIAFVSDNGKFYECIGDWNV